MKIERKLIHQWLPAAITTGAFVGLLMMVAFIPELCPAMETTSSSCGSSTRDTNSGLSILVVVVVFIAGIVAAMIAPPVRTATIANGTAVAVALVGGVGLIASALSGGFAIG